MHPSADTYSELSFAIQAAIISLRSKYDEDVARKAEEWINLMEKTFSHNNKMIKEKIIKFRNKLSEVTQ